MDIKIILLLKYIATFICSFIFSLILNKIIIKIFKSKKLKQVERKYLDNHIIKEGTPSIGGLGIIISSFINIIIFANKLLLNRQILAIIFGYLCFGLIGFIDDYAKIKNKKEDGLSAKKRLLLEFIVVLYIFLILNINIKNLVLSQISFFNNALPLSFLYLPFVIFLIIGCANSVNLSDGLDGLSSGLVVCAIMPFALISASKQEIALTIILLSLIGSILGFMIYNLHPAKLFMGDTGSLSLGCILACVSIYLDKVYILPIAALLFIMETLSVIIQVLYYKKTKKRIFLMTPLHHHYEKKGIKEYRIVSYFWLIGVILSIIASIIGGLL